MHNSFLIDIVCLTSEYHKQLPSALIDKGYSVKSAVKGQPYYSKGIVSIIQYTVSHTNKKSHYDVGNDIGSCFNAIKGYWYCVFIVAGVESYLQIGNINGETDITRVFQMKALW